MTPTPLDGPKPEPIYRVGTLVYNKRQLIILFVWLMWNDFGITLLEAIGQLNGVMMMLAPLRSPEATPVVK